MSNKLSDDEVKHVVFSVTMPKYVVKEIDRTRGFMPRSAWLKTLAVKELKRLHGVPAPATSRTVLEIHPSSKGDDSSHG